VPFLFAGYEQRTLHIAHDSAAAVQFALELDANGKGQWTAYQTVAVPAKGYAYHVFPANASAEWIRLKADRDCRATAYLHFWSPRPKAKGEATLFDAVADADAPARYVGGLIRPAAHNRSLQWLAQTVSADGAVGEPAYREVTLEGTSALVFRTPAESRAEEVLKVGAVRKDFDVDEASVIVTDHQGRRFRLPKGPSAFDRPFPTGWPRGVREAVSERFLANIHGTFYEIPRAGHLARPDFDKMKPVCSHGKLISDFCTWRGLFVVSGARLNARPDGQFLSGDDGQGLWFGTIDDLWKLGKPVGRGGPWLRTPVRAGQPSDPYLMTGYDRKRLELSHDAAAEVTFTIEVDFDHCGFRAYGRIAVPPGKTATHEFPAGYHAHWVRFLADRECGATAILTHE